MSRSHKKDEIFIRVVLVILIVLELLSVAEANESRRKINARVAQFGPLAKQTNFHPDNEFFKRVYINNAATLVIRCEENECAKNSEEVQDEVEKYKNSKSIEISGMWHLFADSNQLKDESSSNEVKIQNLIELFFPASRYGERKNIEEALDLGKINASHFGLTALNLSNNALSERFLDGFALDSRMPPLVRTSLFASLVADYFSHLKLLQLSHNKLQHLSRKHFQLFSSLLNSKLEAVFLDHNTLTSIRHDAFHDLKFLKYLDLSHNRLKLVHPMTFSKLTELTLVNLASNQLKAIFNTAPESKINETNNSSNLKYLYLKGNKDLSCDFGLKWLFTLKDKLELDEFTCNLISSGGNQSIRFDSIEDEAVLANASKVPNLWVDTRRFDATSDYSIFRLWSKRWFVHNFFEDKIEVTTPFPYLMSDDNEDLEIQLANQEKHKFFAWRMTDAVFDCSNRDSSGRDDSDSTIIWKTQFGYLSYLDKELMDSMSQDEEKTEEEDEEEGDEDLKKSSHNSFKIFYKMNKLTKISRSFSVKAGNKYAGQTVSKFYVNSKNQLIVTNLRQSLVGPFVCISVNERGVQMYEYDMHLRAGVSEYFIYCLFVSIVCSVIPSIIGLITCCICEYQADKNYPMTPPCYPTPLASTPPNFDFNEWMSNAASYLPNLNIQETLDQVSKKLRKGMEKASVTVKSLGLTSSAYIYSMYEQSSQRWSDIKSYVPTLNVPTIRYPPMGEFANRMRTGMGNMFIQLREFCGTSDLTHTASIVNIESDTNASNAVGRTYIIEQFNLKPANSSLTIGNHFNNYYKFLSFIKEESGRSKIENSLREECEEEESQAENDENMPRTSSYCPSQRGTNPRLNVIIGMRLDDDSENSGEDEKSSKEVPKTVTDSSSA